MDRSSTSIDREAREFWSGPVARFAAAEDLSNFYNQRARYVADLLKRLQAGQRVLDVGCGSGLLAAALAHLGHDVLALDLSGKQIEHARERCSGLAVEFKQGGIESLDNGERFDVICAIGVLPYLADPGQYALDLCARLTPGGLLVVSLTRARTPFVAFEIVRCIFRLRPYPRRWTIARNLWRTGIWSGGFVAEAGWRRSRPATIDAALEVVRANRVAAFGLFNIDVLDRWFGARARIVRALALHLGWSIVLAYRVGW